MSRSFLGGLMAFAVMAAVPNLSGCGSGSTGPSRDSGRDGTALDSGGDAALGPDGEADAAAEAESGLQGGDADAAPEADASDGSEDVADGGLQEDADGGPEADVAEDAARCNSNNCGGACCGTKCVQTCAGCAMGAVFCPEVPAEGLLSNGTCVADCAHCGADAGAPAPLTCSSCATGPALEVCAQDFTQCPIDPQNGACPCSAGDGGACRGPTEACVSVDASGSFCLACGHPGTNGQACGNGMTCTAAEAGCL